MYFLLIVITLLLPISYYTFKKDFASPSFLMYIGYFIAAVAATYNIVAWNIDISNQLIAIFLTGWFSFFLGELFVREVLYKEKRRGGFISYNNNLREIKVEKVKVFIIILIDMIITLLLYREVVRIASIGGASSESMMYNYKANLFETGMSGLVTQTTKFTKGAAYVFLFVFVNNIIAQDKINKKYMLRNVLYLIPGIIYCVQCFLRGGRYTVIAYIIAVVFEVYFFMQYKNNWKYTVPLKIIVRMMGIVFVIFIGFWLVKEMVGRSSEASFLEYITRYIGGPYELFSLYLNDPPSASNETFAGILTSLNKLGLTDASIRAYHEFRFSTTNVLLGNVYTAFRTYYNDYGVVGVGLLSFLLSLIFNVAYHKLRRGDIYRYKFQNILYSSLLYCIVFNFFVDYFYARLSLGYLIEIFIMYIIYFFVFRTRIKQRLE